MPTTLRLTVTLAYALAAALNAACLAFGQPHWVNALACAACLWAALHFGWPRAKGR